jgi:hypothetical protein
MPGEHPTPRLAPMRTALIITLAIGATAVAGSAAADARSPASLKTITVAPAGPSARTVTIATAGAPFRTVYVCDQVTPTCVRAHRTSTHVWHATLAATDPASDFSIGVIARARGRYVTAHLGSAPAAPVSPHNGI